jgi:hypothetical protein
MVRDMGTHGSPPTRVLEIHVKWARPARSLTDLQVARRPYLKPRRPRKTSGDLTQTPEDLPGMWRKLLP